MLVSECHVDADVREDRRERERESTGSLGAGAIGASEPPVVGAGNQTALEDQWLSYLPSAVTRHHNQSVYSSRAKIRAHHDEEDSSRQQTECWAVREGELGMASAFETWKPTSSATPSPTGLHLLILPRQSHQLCTKHSNVWAYGGHSHANHHKQASSNHWAISPTLVIFIIGTAGCVIVPWAHWKAAIMETWLLTQFCLQFLHLFLHIPCVPYVTKRMRLFLIKKKKTSKLQQSWKTKISLTTHQFLMDTLGKFRSQEGGTVWSQQLAKGSSILLCHPLCSAWLYSGW